MPKKQRLTRADFARASASRSRRMHGALFSLVISETGSARAPKAACVVPKKVAARASDRNLIKRRCREALRPLLLKSQKSYVCIFHAKREALTASYADIARDVASLLQRGVGAL